MILNYLTFIKDKWSFTFLCPSLWYPLLCHTCSLCCLVCGCCTCCTFHHDPGLGPGLGQDCSTSDCILDHVLLHCTCPCMNSPCRTHWGRCSSEVASSHCSSQQTMLNAHQDLTLKTERKRLVWFWQFFEKLKCKCEICQQNKARGIEIWLQNSVAILQNQNLKKYLGGKFSGGLLKTNYYSKLSGHFARLKDLVKKNNHQKLLSGLAINFELCSEGKIEE